MRYLYLTSIYIVAKLGFENDKGKCVCNCIPRVRKVRVCKNLNENKMPLSAVHAKNYSIVKLIDIPVLPLLGLCDNIILLNLLGTRAVASILVLKKIFFIWMRAPKPVSPALRLGIP